MNERQQRFADAYLENPNATKAAEAAGYSRKTAYSQGQRLLKNAEVAAYIRERQEQAADARILSITRARALLSDIAQDADIGVSARLRAVDLLLKSAGAQLSPPTAEPPQSSTEPNEPPDDQQGDFVRIILPWNGSGPINAALLPDGSVVPLAGHEQDDLLIYQPQGETSHDLEEAESNDTG